MKKIFCALLLCGLLFSAAACKSSSTPDDGGGKEGGTAQSKETEKKSNEDKNDGMLHIKTPEDMADFAERVNNGETTLCAVLENDIDMSSICSAAVGNWTSIKNFEGDFDGQEYKLQNLYIVQTDTAALFTSLKGTVKNVNLENVVIESTESSAAGISSGLNGQIENCCVSGNIKAYKYAGGIALDTYTDSVVTNCINEADIYGGYFDEESHYLKGAAAGIVAWPREGGIITGCINRGAVSGNGNITGGIVGHCEKGNILIEDCVNEGNVQGRSGAAELVSWGENYTGGIAGYAGANTVITKCVNDGSVSGTGRVGGIAGESGNYLINCANHGALEATEGGQVCGIACTALEGLLNCYNTGNMTCDHYANAIGYASNAVEVNLYNFGTVTCTSDSGVLTDGFPWSMGGAVSGLLNTYSRENCIIVPDSFQDNSPSSIQVGNAAPDTAFTDGTILEAFNETVADINGNLEGNYSGLDSYIRELKNSEYFELSTWKSGTDGFPCFEWE